MRQNLPRKPGGVSRAATACYILFAALLLYAAARFSGNIAARELLRTPLPNAPEPTPAAVDAAPEQTAAQALAVRTPEPLYTSDPNGGPAPSASPDAAPPTPAPTGTSVPSSLEAGRIDLPIIGFDETGHADAVSVLAVRGDACTLLAIPKNTLVDGRPLSGATAVETVLSRLQSLLGVAFPYYVSYEVAAVPTCVDAVGGVTIDGTARTGEQARAYLETGGQDELLRAARQQIFLQAFALRVQDMNLFEIWGAKRQLQDSADSNLSGEHGWLLYRTLRALPLEQLDLRLLPVDSTEADGVRCYVPDAEIVDKIVTELYKTR